MHLYGAPAHLEAETMHFYGTPAHLEGESLLLNQLGDQAKTAPGAPETKKAPFQAKLSLQIVVSGRPSKKRKSGPPNNSDQPVALEGRLEGESLHFLRSMWLWMSPLCSCLAIFYMSARPGRQKIAASSTAAQNLTLFCSQCGCGCRHSAAVWPFSICSPALGDKLTVTFPKSNSTPPFGQALGNQVGK